MRFGAWKTVDKCRAANAKRRCDATIKNPKYNYLMNKSDLVNAIAAGAELSKADAKKALDATLNAIADALKEGDKVALLGFGTFAVTERPARTGINPATKEKIEIAAKKVIKFKAGAELADGLK